MITFAAESDLLNDVRDFIRQFVAFPGEADLAAVTLWAAHCHVVTAFESTPRLALLSPEPGSGKTRCLEVLDLLVPDPLLMVNPSPAPLFRLLAGDAQPTFLLDESDAIFSRRTGDDPAADLRSLIDNGHRQGGTVVRCVPPKHTATRFPVFAAVALAGLGDLPPTVLDRSVIVRMRRRAPSEHVVPFRRRMAAPAGAELRERLAEWLSECRDELARARPDLPAGVEDRPADVWEPLIAIADQAGGHWPETARRACAVMVAASQSSDNVSLGIRLLADVRAAFEQAGAEAMHTIELLTTLNSDLEAPWGDLDGTALSARGLASRLKQFGVHPVDVRSGREGTNRKGYKRSDFWDPWQRYLPVKELESADSPGSATSATGATAELESPQSGQAALSPVCDPWRVGVSGR